MGVLFLERDTMSGGRERAERMRRKEKSFAYKLRPCTKHTMSALLKKNNNNGLMRKPEKAGL